MKIIAAVFAVIFIGISGGILWTYMVNVSPLARPAGVPRQARNLGNMVEPTYWHYCDKSNEVRVCETYRRSGGFPRYSGLYMPLDPHFTLRLSQGEAGEAPVVAEAFALLRMKVIFDEGYNWPLIERIAPVVARNKWSYRFFLPQCLEPVSRSNLSLFIERDEELQAIPQEEYREKLVELFGRIDVEITFDEEGETISLIDRVAEVSGTTYLRPGRRCLGRIYLDE